MHAKKRNKVERLGRQEEHLLWSVESLEKGPKKISSKKMYGKRAVGLGWSRRVILHTCAHCNWCTCPFSLVIMGGLMISEEKRVSRMEWNLFKI